MNNLGINSSFGGIARAKCRCRNCMGIIPNNVKVFDTNNNDILPPGMKQLIKESLLPSTRFKSVAFL